MQTQCGHLPQSGRSTTMAAMRHQMNPLMPLMQHSCESCM